MYTHRHRRHKLTHRHTHTCTDRGGIKCTHTHSHKNEILPFCNMGESRRSDAQLSKSGREKQIPHYLTDTQNLKNKKATEWKDGESRHVAASSVVVVCHRCRGKKRHGSHTHSESVMGTLPSSTRNAGQ